MLFRSVEAVGEGVTHLKAGDRAAYASNPPGSYSDMRVMPARNVVKLPDGIAFSKATGMTRMEVDAAGKKAKVDWINNLTRTNGNYSMMKQ